MATGILTPWPRYTVLNAAGKPISGALLNTYIAGTSTPIATYSDVALTIPNANPIVANSSGQIGPVFLSPGSSYKFVFTNPDASALFTQDNVAPGGGATNTDIIGTAGEALTAGKAVYLSDGSGGKTAGLWYLADAANTYSSTSPNMGIAPASIASGSAGTITLAGQVTGLTSLTIGAAYYVGTAGAITSTPPVNRRFVGQADTTSSLVMTPPSFYNDLGLAPLTNGQLIVGSTGAAAVAATLTAGAGISVTNAAGSITVANVNGVVDRSVTAVSISNTATETQVYGYTVLANTLGTSKTLHVRCVGNWRDNAAPGAHTITVRVKFGASTFFNSTLTSSAQSANNGDLILDFELTAANATSSQISSGTLLAGDGVTNNVGGVMNGTVGTFGGAVLHAIGVGSIDTTANQTLSVTYQLSVADANLLANKNVAYTELK